MRQTDDRRRTDGTAIAYSEREREFAFGKMVTKTIRLATSGRHNSAMSTNAENLRPNGLPTGCLVFIFTVRINSKSFFWTVRCVPERNLLKFPATSFVRYCPIVRCSASAA